MRCRSADPRGEHPRHRHEVALARDRRIGIDRLSEPRTVRSEPLPQRGDIGDVPLERAGHPRVAQLRGRPVLQLGRSHGFSP